MQNVKPAAKADLLSEWSDGALIVNYAGHGSPIEMAHEKIFLRDDVYSLKNGIWSPLFLAFSCTIGNMESPYTHDRSIGQIIIMQQEGGAIGVVAGVAPTFGRQNDYLNNCFFSALFPIPDATSSVPIGTALQLAKICSYTVYPWNNSKYALIGDPALTLAVPRYSVEHEAATIDTLYTGNRYSVNGAVTMGGEVLTSFNGSAEIVVQEAQRKVVEDVQARYVDTLRYAMPGKPLFRGNVDVTQGRFRTSFVVPRRCRTGSRPRAPR